MIVWLASFPRSGNTMIRLLLREVYGWQSSAVYDESGATMITDLGLAEAGQPPNDTALDEARRRPTPYFLKTHELPHDQSPALYVVRDGRDTLVSYAHFVLAHEPGMSARFSFDDMLRILIESRDHFGGWSGHVRSWCARAAEAATEWVRYEDLLSEPLRTLDGGLRKLGVDISPTGGQPTTFEELNSKWPDFFRKGQPGAWRDEMSDQLHELFWAHHQEAMGWLGYHRTGTFDQAPTNAGHVRVAERA